MDYQEIISLLKSKSNKSNLAGMARFGINPEYALGVSVTELRKVAKQINKNHSLALKLWDSGIHEARILSSMVDEADKVTKKQMDNWIKEFNSWDLCDQVCANLFDKTPFAFEKAIQWSKRKKEYEKRAGFALMACLAWHDKTSPDSKFIKFFPYIKHGSTDNRNFIKKAVSWALRQIGKKNKNLNRQAIKLSKEIQQIDSRAASWISKDALRELQSPSVHKRLN